MTSINKSFVVLIMSSEGLDSYTSPSESTGASTILYLSWLKSLNIPQNRYPQNSFPQRNEMAMHAILMKKSKLLD